MSCPWHHYSKKLQAKIAKPHNVGFFNDEQATQREMRCIVTKQGLVEDGNSLCLYWLVDPADGTIVDARFQAFGHSALLAAADTVCDLLIGKNYDQARRLGADLIDKQLRDHPDKPAFPEQTYAYLNLVIDVIEEAALQCVDIDLPQTYFSPVPQIEGEAIANWEELSHEQKLAIIQEVIDKEISPYVELDAGGVEIVELKADGELVIGYKGSCTSCYSAIGGTLSAISQIMTSKVHPSLRVVPDLSGLMLE